MAENNIADLYKEFVKTTAIYPKEATPEQTEAMYLALGLSDEAGEVAGKIKKWFRDGVLDREGIKKELGDEAWYFFMLLNVLGFTLEEVLVGNRDKLIDRQNRDKLGGSGDDR